MSGSEDRGSGCERKGSSTGPVCSLPPAAVRLFCDGGVVWFALSCCLFFVLFSYLRWCSFSLGFEGLHYPQRKAFIWTFWEGQRNVALKRPEPKYKKLNGAFSPPWSLMSAEGKEVREQAAVLRP